MRGLVLEAEDRYRTRTPSPRACRALATVRASSGRPLCQPSDRAETDPQDARRLSEADDIPADRGMA